MLSAPAQRGWRARPDPSPSPGARPQWDPPPGAQSTPAPSAATAADLWGPQSSARPAEAAASGQDSHRPQWCGDHRYSEDVMERYEGAQQRLEAFCPPDRVQGEVLDRGEGALDTELTRLFYNSGKVGACGNAAMGRGRNDVPRAQGGRAASPRGKWNALVAPLEQMRGEEARMLVAERGSKETRNAVRGSGSPDLDARSVQASPFQGAAQDQEALQYLATVGGMQAGMALGQEHRRRLSFQGPSAEPCSVSSGDETELERIRGHNRGASFSSTIGDTMCDLAVGSSTARRGRGGGNVAISEKVMAELKSAVASAGPHSPKSPAPFNPARGEKPRRGLTRSDYWTRLTSPALGPPSRNNSGSGSDLGGSSGGSTPMGMYGADASCASTPGAMSRVDHWNRATSPGGQMFRKEPGSGAANVGGSSSTGKIRLGLSRCGMGALGTLSMGQSESRASHMLDARSEKATSPANDWSQLLAAARKTGVAAEQETARSGMAAQGLAVAKAKSGMGTEGQAVVKAKSGMGNEGQAVVKAKSGMGTEGQPVVKAKNGTGAEGPAVADLRERSKGLIDQWNMLAVRSAPMNGSGDSPSDTITSSDRPRHCAPEVCWAPLGIPALGQRTSEETVPPAECCDPMKDCTHASATGSPNATQLDGKTSDGVHGVFWYSDSQPGHLPYAAEGPCLETGTGALQHAELSLAGCSGSGAGQVGQVNCSDGLMVNSSADSNTLPLEGLNSSSGTLAAGLSHQPGGGLGSFVATMDLGCQPGRSLGSFAAGIGLSRQPGSGEFGSGSAHCFARKPPRALITRSDSERSSRTSFILLNLAPKESWAASEDGDPGTAMGAGNGSLCACGLLASNCPVCDFSAAAVQQSRQVFPDWGSWRGPSDPLISSDALGAESGSAKGDCGLAMPRGGSGSSTSSSSSSSSRAASGSSVEHITQRPLWVQRAHSMAERGADVRARAEHYHIHVAAGHRRVSSMFTGKLDAAAGDKSGKLGAASPHSHGRRWSLDNGSHFARGWRAHTSHPASPLTGSSSAEGRSVGNSPVGDVFAWATKHRMEQRPGGPAVGHRESGE